MGLSRKNQSSSVIIVHAEFAAIGTSVERVFPFLTQHYLKGIHMKKVILPLLIGFGLMVGATSTLSAGCGCPKIHFGCKKKAVKKVKKAKAKKAKSCSIPCPHFGCSK
jgi:hypothetical protein